jgi:hypothetical protein
MKSVITPRKSSKSENTSQYRYVGLRVKPACAGMLEAFT